MADEPLAKADPPIDATRVQREMQQVLFDRTAQLADEVLQRLRAWPLRWFDSSVARDVAAISAVLRGALERLLREFARPDGPRAQEVGTALARLRDMPGAPGPLERLRMLIGDDPKTMSLDDQRLLSELAVLSLRLQGLRDQWQEYQDLGAPDQSAGTQHHTEPLAAIPAPPRRNAALAGLDQEDLWLEPLFDSLAEERQASNARPAAWQRRGASGTLGTTLTVLVVLVLVIFLAYQGAIHLPGARTQPTFAPASPLAPTATQAAPATTTAAPQTTTTTTPQPTPDASPSATATTPPGGGATQLSVNPPVLTIPCPGTGAASLQLVNTGSQALDWQATASGPSGEILLDGAASQGGRLNPGDETTLSVTAQARNLQGTITITYTGAPDPIMVGYSVGC